MPDMIVVFTPLVALIVCGFILGRCVSMDLKTIANLAIYYFTPVVCLGATAQLKISSSALFLPVFIYIGAAFVGLTFFFIGQRFLKEKTQSHLLPIAAGVGNTGYFGFPVALALFGETAAGLYLIGNLAVILFESTIGYYCVSRGKFSARDALRKVLKLPALYALIAGLIISALEIPLSAPFLKFWDMSKNTYTCLGMTIIGIALAQQKRFTLSPRLAALTVVGKLLVWPGVAVSAVLLDQSVLHLLSPLGHSCLLLMSVTPTAANLTAFAAQHHLHEDQAAGLVLLTTTIAIIGLPVVLPLILGVAQSH